MAAHSRRSFIYIMMHTIESAILRMGLRTRTQNIPTVLNGGSTQKIGGQLQTDIGLIYGLSIYADTVDPSGNTLITTTQATNLYLTIAKGAQQFVQTLRLDDLLNVFAGSPLVRLSKFTPVLISYKDFALDVSFYSNPLLISGPEIYLMMWYIDMDSYQELINRGPDYGLATPETTTHIKQEVQQMKR